MSHDENAYLEFLEKVEKALDEALERDVVPQGHTQRAELESMREEVVQVRRAIRRKHGRAELRAIEAR